MSEYEQHLLGGGAPFGGPFNATIREVVEGYQAVIAHLRRPPDPNASRDTIYR